MVDRAGTAVFEIPWPGPPLLQGKSMCLVEQLSELTGPYNPDVCTAFAAVVLLPLVIKKDSSDSAEASRYNRVVVIGVVQPFFFQRSMDANIVECLC